MNTFILIIAFMLIQIVMERYIRSVIVLIKAHGITKRDAAVLFIAILAVVITLIQVKMFSSIYSEMTKKKVYNMELESNINYMDSTVTDSSLYATMKEMRMPHAKIAFAQAKLESNNYKSSLFVNNQNLFGMKFAVKRPTVAIGDAKGYQLYASWRESVVDYLIWQYANGSSQLSDEEYMEYLGQYYAEDPQYIKKVKNIISKMK